MKNFIKIAFLFVMTVITLASCSKDQNCVNWLEGEWRISSYISTDASGNSVNLINSTTTGKMTFSKYDINEEDFGRATAILSGSFSDTSMIDYKITDDCKTFSTRLSFSSSAFEVANILESSSKKMVFESVNSLNTRTKITIEK